jgi:hypothetical protein
MMIRLCCTAISAAQKFSDSNCKPIKMWASFLGAIEETRDIGLPTAIFCDFKCDLTFLPHGAVRIREEVFVPGARFG